MATLNKVIIAGKLTRKPELRRTPNGTAVTDLLVALNREFMTSSGEKQKETCFVDVVVWERPAEICAEYLSCSSAVLVEGRLQLDTWFSKEGEKRCKLRIAAEKVQFMDKKSSIEAVSEVLESQETLEALTV